MKNIEEIEKIVINVDMVNGFVNEGPMHDEYIRNTIPYQISLMELARQDPKAMNIIVKDTHKEDAVEFKKFPVHCVENTHESELIDELKRFETEDALVFKKNSTSAMHAPGFLEAIDSFKNLKEVVIVGCCTDICVLNLVIPLQTYFDDRNKDILITVPKKMVETYNSEEHKREEYNEMAFKLMKQAGVVIK
ncbi:MAG: cysteine hydrolase [Clostridia bacterium]|nr:cysteine hydrolase [Clostridia bacterium]